MKRFIPVLLLMFSKIFAATPTVLQVQCGKLEIFLDSRFFWNLNGIKRNDVMIGRQERGFYGTVIRYDIGWVGTGHLENKIGEKDVQMKFFCDDKEFTPDGKKISCRKFMMKKTSLLHHAKVDYTLILEDDLITETAAIRFLKDEEIQIAYNFMHPWHSAFENYRTISTSGKAVSGTMPEKENNKRYVFDEPYAASFYSEELKTAIISKVTCHNSPAGSWLFWNRGQNDRKLYYRPLLQSQVKAGDSMRWTMTTSFKTISFDDWQKLEL